MKPRDGGSDSERRFRPAMWQPIRRLALGCGSLALMATLPALISCNVPLTGVAKQQLGMVALLSVGDSYDDFPALAEKADGTIYATYVAYVDGRDQLRLHKRLDDGSWLPHIEVPLAGASADIWMPQIAVDIADRLWVVWSEQVSGNWDLYARALTGESWGPLLRLSDDPAPDINHHLAKSPGGDLYLVWQAHPEGTGDVLLRRFSGDRWSSPVAITTGPDSDWYPRVAVDSRGVAWIAFDSYRNGDYDVFLISLTGDEVGPLVEVATSDYYEAHASVACTPDGRVWVSWEEGGAWWGKDRGHWLAIHDRNVGSLLGEAREVRVAAFYRGQLWSAPGVEEVLPEYAHAMRGGASLATGSDGRLWLRFRSDVQQQRKGRSPDRYFAENVTYLTPDGWAPVHELVGGAGRYSVFNRLLPVGDGSVLVAYSGDQRRAYSRMPIRDQVRVATLRELPRAAGRPNLEPYRPRPRPAGLEDWDSDGEAEDVAAVRDYRATIGLQSYQIVRGDLHRHTAFSKDQMRKMHDGSFLDFYRYMIDVAEMDFGAITDHAGGGPQNDYWWWLTQKSADLYNLETRFVPLFGYERSVAYPYGHRNVFHDRRGVPVFPIPRVKTGERPSSSSDQLALDDSQLLFRSLQTSDGISIPHTSATHHGTDWAVHDSAVEPVVEIYQGSRGSFEALDGPRAYHNAPPTPVAYTPRLEGLIQNAWEKGYRLGVIASSDHKSSHISYAMVYTPYVDRKSILQAIRQRHTYAATDNIIVDFRAHGRMMGDELTTTDPPTLELRALGTALIERVELIRGQETIYIHSPASRQVDLRYRDEEPIPGLSYYYFRIIQEDGEIAWTSPIWIRIPK